MDICNGPPNLINIKDEPSPKKIVRNQLAEKEIIVNDESNTGFGSATHPNPAASLGNSDGHRVSACAK